MKNVVRGQEREEKGTTVEHPKENPYYLSLETFVPCAR
jgi:hypothetical protein